MANYTNIMATGLNSRLAYNKAGSRGGGRVSAPKSEGLAERRHRQNMEELAEKKQQGNIDEQAGRIENNALKTAADVDKTEADIKSNALKAERDLKKSEAELKESKIKRTTKGLQNIASFAGQLTQKNYPSWYKWVNETKGFSIPSDMFIPPDEMNTYEPEKATAYFNQIGSLAKPDASTVNSAIKAHEEELERKAAETKAEALVAKQDKSIKATDRRKAEDNMRKDEKSLTEAETQILGKSKKGKSYTVDKNGTAPYVNQYNKLAKRLDLGYEYVWDEDAEIEVPRKVVGNLYPDKVPGYVKVKTETPADVPKVPELSEGVDENNYKEIATQEEYNALPSGVIYTTNGKKYRKP